MSWEVLLRNFIQTPEDYNTHIPSKAAPKLPGGPRAPHHSTMLLAHGILASSSPVLQCKSLESQWAAGRKWSTRQEVANQVLFLLGIHAIRNEPIHKFIYLFHTGAKEHLPFTQVFLKSTGFLCAENRRAAIFKAI